MLNFILQEEFRHWFLPRDGVVTSCVKTVSCCFYYRICF